ncbi:MAG TPA: sn-glycerol-3-phosphate ABC transporter ATP-binding protein UgpC [Geminicoccaceae bacterium]|nr:sn-glycerol-3-phosphate ABC transporter ATP-binding protein UgpC [Geminicoccaceae bacterium]
MLDLGPAQRAVVGGGPGEMADVALEGISKSFGRVEVIRGVDLDIRSNEFAVFVGPSGCGKSTLLRLVAGLEDITAGELYIGGKLVNDLPPAERGIAMVFQSYALYPHMSVYDNMAFGLKLAKRDRAAIDRRVREAARILQVEHLLDRKPRQLSGGQRQRVAIGRAIVREPRVFLFDEPLSNLDAALRVQMRIELAKLHRGLDATMIYVTHDQVEAMTLADRIVVLNAGRVEQVGSPLELYHHPRNLFVAGFIGSPRMNFMPGEVAGGTGGGAMTVRLPGGASVALPVTRGGVRVGEKVTLGLRPEHLREGGGGDAQLRGRVIAVEHLGGETYVYLDVGQGDPLVVKAGGDSAARVDEVVPVGVPAAACYVFNEAGAALPRPAYR